MARKALILGATSAIARATAELMAKDGDALFLVARDAGLLGALRDDLAVRGTGKIETFTADLNEIGLHEQIVERAVDALGGLDTAIVAHGILGDRDECERDFARAELVFQTNFVSAASLLTILGRRFAAQGGGTIAAISSVAGDRGRQSNYFYGASKAALSAFLQGLRNRLFERGVAVITVKPGFVDTPMTAHLEKGLLFASAAAVGRGIHRALGGGRDVVYLPWFWRPIMIAVRLVPEFVFKRAKL